MSQQEIDDALSKLEEEHDIPGPEDIQDEDIQEDEELSPEPENPPGYISYDDWVAKGKDPDEWKGKKAYEAEYDRIKKISDLENTLKKTVTAVDQWQQQREQEMREKLEAEFAQAKEEEDIDKALEIKGKLDNLPSDTPKLNPVMDDFFKKNPILDRTSPNFNQEFWDDMSMFHDSLLREMTGGNPNVQLTKGQIERVMNVSFAKTKGLHPDKFKSQRNARQSAPTAQRRANKSEPATSKLGTIKNSKNQRDTNPAKDIYDMLAKTDPKAAETFAKNVLGE